MKKIFIAALFAASFFIIACNGGSKSSTETTKDSTSAGSGSTSTSTSTAPVSNNIQISANDQMKFSTNELRVKANEKVSLTMKNEGTQPKEAMGHNFVLLKDGTDLAGFAAAAISAPDHIPANNPAIIAHTKLLGPGESDTIEFTVPAGSYTYICSFPGHYLTMTGILTAE